MGGPGLSWPGLWGPPSRTGGYRDAMTVEDGNGGYPCYSLIQNSDGAFDHWNLTGDPEGYRSSVGIVEYVRTSPHIGRGVSTREQG